MAIGDTLGLKPGMIKAPMTWKPKHQKEVLAKERSEGNGFYSGEAVIS
jgi:hypothetical protein